MADASDPLHKAIVARLKGHSAVAALVAGRVYDSVPAGAVKPYISLGPFDVLPEQAAEYDGSDTTFQIDGWSEGPASVEIKRLGAAIRAALDEAPLALEGHRLVGLDVESTRYLKEPDGKTQHAVVTFRARTEPTE